VTYTYDALNRLASAVTSDNPNVTQWGQSYAYDGFGNLTDQNVIKGSAPSMHVTYNPNNYGGDANGNQSPYPYTLVYDIENRVVQVNPLSNTAGYGYDPGNKRMYRGEPSQGIDEIDFWGVTGQKLGAYQISVSGSALRFSLTSTNVYFGGKLVSRGAPGGSHQDGIQLTAVTTDRLGSRMPGKS
jgi:YD repeat-containing protein